MVPRRKRRLQSLRKLEHLLKRLERLERKLDRRERELARLKRELESREKKLERREKELKRLERKLKRRVSRSPSRRTKRPRLRRLPRPIGPPGKGPSVTPGRFYSLMRRFIREIADEIHEQSFGFRARGDRPGGGKLGRSVVGSFAEPLELDEVLERVRKARSVFGKVDRLPAGYLWFLLLEGVDLDEDGEIVGGGNVYGTPHSETVAAAIVNLETEAMAGLGGTVGSGGSAVHFVTRISAVLLFPREKRRGKKARGRRRRRH